MNTTAENVFQEIIAYNQVCNQRLLLWTINATHCIIYIKHVVMHLSYLYQIYYVSISETSLKYPINIFFSIHHNVIKFFCASP